MFTSLLFVPAVILLGLVLPLWLVLHYVTLWRHQKRSGGIDAGALAEMEATARRLEDRIAALERVLDADEPSGRGKP